MELNHIYQGTCLEVIKTFPDKSIDCVITSPPYWQLRDYGWDGQWGNESTFQMYLENLWSLMDEVWRVLKDTGTVWVNLGDTYNGNKKGNRSNKGYIENTIVDTFKKEKQPTIPDKCLLLIPHRFGIGCIDRGWVMRNDVIWAKRNGMPESVTDRFSKKHEYFFLMAKTDNYYFDLESIRDNHIWAKRDKRSQVQGGVLSGGKTATNEYGTNKVAYNPNGKNPGSVSDFWDIPTKGNNDSHYASYNTNLIDKPIIAGCPIDGVILDPFCGTATTGCRAIDLQRKFIGIEGKKEYVTIGNKKLHPYKITKQLF